MYKITRHYLKKHKYKIALGVPMIFLLASSLSLIRDTEEMRIVSEDNSFVEVGETVTIHVIANADKPVNVIGATVNVPEELIEIVKVSRENSIIDLWSEEPKIKDSSIHFSGGIVNETGFLGEGVVLTVILTPKQEGTANIYLKETSMLAHDGTGMPVTCDNKPITFTIRPESHPNPDVNGDKHVNIFDFGIISARLFMRYERSYDLNLDGKITLADIGVLISNMTTRTQLASLAISFIE